MYLVLDTFIFANRPLLSCQRNSRHLHRVLATSDCHVGDISTKLSLNEIRTPRCFVALIG